MTLEGRVVIITGAAGGIGSATARAFAARGANLVLADREFDKLNAVATTLKDRGAAALAVRTDVRERADVDALVDAAMKAFGRIDVACNVAGVGSSPSLADCTDEEIESVVGVNLLGAARVMHAVLPVMKRQQRGAIINVGSVAGEAGVMGIYSASKFGLRGLTDSVRREVRSSKISVTLVEPGFVRTAMNPAMNGRLPGPEIVASAIVRAVTRPKRVRIVPASYWLPVYFARLFPGLMDLIFGDARIQERLNRDSRAERAFATRATDEDPPCSSPPSS